MRDCSIISFLSDPERKELISFDPLNHSRLLETLSFREQQTNDHWNYERSKQEQQQ